MGNVIQVSQAVHEKDTGLTSASGRYPVRGPAHPAHPPVHKAAAPPLSHKADWSFCLHLHLSASKSNLTHRANPSASTNVNSQWCTLGTQSFPWLLKSHIWKNLTQDLLSLQRSTLKWIIWPWKHCSITSWHHLPKALGASWTTPSSQVSSQ